ncbi:MAG: toxin-antitoxin system HicB family antitoxin [Candidatus Tectomicrobia bacterium]|uniref:Toxin-antitoxin system HicB family antitoxin n=1 Tax=Tectimicrobiota bacterium TaxID=2528274 RepID=A0A937W3P3_UNCTE|nr:toxin-antitoxin system HicB family antitoxin [Candidatus Tectomicrobia bacterium]
MSTLSLTLPESIYKHVCQLAEQDGVSVDQFIATAVAEKIAVLLTIEYLQERAKRGNREKFEAVLAKVPDVAPDEYDQL